MIHLYFLQPMWVLPLPSCCSSLFCNGCVSRCVHYSTSCCCCILHGWVLCILSHWSCIKFCHFHRGRFYCSYFHMMYTCLGCMLPTCRQKMLKWPRQAYEHKDYWHHNMKIILRHPIPNHCHTTIHFTSACVPRHHISRINMVPVIVIFDE